MLKKQRFLNYCLQGIKFCRTFAVQTTKKSDKQTIKHYKQLNINHYEKLQN